MNFFILNSDLVLLGSWIYLVMVFELTKVLAMALARV